MLTIKRDTPSLNHLAERRFLADRRIKGDRREQFRFIEGGGRSDRRALINRRQHLKGEWGSHYIM